jgi:hypothetical protein
MSSRNCRKASTHQTLDKAHRCARLRCERGSHHKSRQDGYKLKFLFSGEIFNKFPSGFLSKNLRLRIVIISACLRLRPNLLGELSFWSIFFRNFEDAKATRGDNGSFDLVELAGFEGVDGALNCRLNHIII